MGQKTLKIQNANLCDNGIVFLFSLPEFASEFVYPPIVGDAELIEKFWFRALDASLIRHCDLKVVPWNMGYLKPSKLVFILQRWWCRQEYFFQMDHLAPCLLIIKEKNPFEWQSTQSNARLKNKLNILIWNNKKWYQLLIISHENSYHFFPISCWLSTP